MTMDFEEAENLENDMWEVRRDLLRLRDVLRDLPMVGETVKTYLATIDRKLEYIQMGAKDRMEDLRQVSIDSDQEYDREKNESPRPRSNPA